ncbi:MAG TPA: lysine--tRNA ligase [Phycisphaerales bacterium]|nr:lysine--tRNA ligase [Phycisphaerales bacterium]
MSSQTEHEQPVQTPEIHPLVQQRIENRESLRSETGLEPYGQAERHLTSLAEAAAMYDQAADEDHKAHGKEDGHTDRRPRVTVAGRIMLSRDNGKLIWLNLRDDTGDLQVAVSKRDCDEAGFKAAKLLDNADIVVVEGPITRTRTGEVTVWASSLRLASKSLTPPPEKWAGLQDIELRYRKRYVDLWANPEALRVFQLRSKIVSGIRRLMDEQGFLEVETPMLQAQAGGAAARPFITHMNALDIDLSMRIAPELYLKRLLVGGMRKVYEINRNFRNEGLDKQHNPEFTAIEAYEAFGNYETVMELSEAIIRRAAAIVSGSDENLKLPFGGLEIDYAKPFERVTYAALFERALGFAMDDTIRARAEAEKRGIRTRSDDGEPMDDVWVVNELFEAVAEKSIDPSVPTWVMDYPSALSPLTRPKADDPSIAERADLFIAGMEVGPHYTELNDPDIQLERFREQLAGIDDDESTFRTLDEDFVEALRVGMPPAGGMGLGIDRLVMLLTNSQTIRDVILFPLLREI